jgi:hypothetical protein
MAETTTKSLQEIKSYQQDLPKNSSISLDLYEPVTLNVTNFNIFFFKFQLNPSNSV